MAQVKAKKVVGHAARLEHLRRKIHKTRKELRDSKQVPAEVSDALLSASRQLAHAIDLLDQMAGEAARNELTGEDGGK
jgi:hypothetical protein